MRLILGVDEAGRGPLAGPVSVGVVSFEGGLDLLSIFPGLNDSKQLSEKKREIIFEMLQEQKTKGNVQFRVEFSSARMIDEEGIILAVKSALNKGVKTLLPNGGNEKIFLDGALYAPSEYNQETVIGGDSVIPAIMLASIAAKVMRDRHMTEEIAKQFPVYGFEKHKGYGTKAHYVAISEHGLCDEHRRTYIHLAQKQA